MKRVFICLTVASLATILVPVSAHASNLAFDAAGNLFWADGPSVFKYTPDGAKSSFARSSSLDQKWEYNKDDDQPKIVKAGTNEVALELNGIGGLDWAPDSKRFACYSGGGGRSHTIFLYQLCGDEWKELQEPIDAVYEILNKVIAAQVKKRGLPKKTDLRLIWETVDLDRWVDSSTAIVYAGRREVVRENVDEGFGADFLLTLKLDEAGHCKIVKTHRMSERELEKREKGE
jgi:hypothetical protein